MFVEYVPWSDTMDAVDPNVLFFEETGQKLRDGFAHYWQQHGGLARFGYPLTDELLESDPITGKLYVAQYFERARFEYRPELADTPDSIRTTPLAERLLQRHGINWQELPRVEHAPPECLVFQETGHSLCPPFRAVWEDYGGTALLGYPLTEPFDATHLPTESPYHVQYFEKARLELIPAQDGHPSGIQFGSLGRELFTGVRGMP